MVFERFTDHARRTIVVAQQEARASNHARVDAEHLLLGAIGQSDCTAVEVLVAMGISLDSVRTQVVEILGGGDRTESGHIPFAPGAKKVLERSLREAMGRDVSYIGTEHFLLAITGLAEGPAAKILSEHGADYTRVQQGLNDLPETREA